MVCYLSTLLMEVMEVMAAMVAMEAEMEVVIMVVGMEVEEETFRHIMLSWLIVEAGG